MGTQEEINIRTFVEGIGRVSSSNLLELTKVSLSLLRTTPAVKDAALEFYCTLFNMAVRTYLANLETEMSMRRTSVDAGDNGAEEEEASVAEVHLALCNYVTMNPEVWAPIVSTWSLQLLGQLSTRYAGRAHIPLDAGLSEKMNLWMGCRATRTLMDITTQCLSCLMDSDTETCISALLDSSVKHSPHFDWVVAHVGNCFPDTVITRVLSCGLKDFAQHSRASSQSSIDRAHRLASIVGILDHLASSHFNDIRTALLDLFTRSLQFSSLEQDTKLLRKVTVPFLLQLASTSSTLRKALTANIQQTVNISTVCELSKLVSDWCKHFESSEALMDLVVKLALGCEQGGLQIINLLLDCILADELTLPVKQHCRLILETILMETDILIRTNNNVDLLTSIGKDLTTLEQLLIDCNELRQNTACRVVTLLGNRNPVALMLIGSFLLRKSKTDNQLFLLVNILSDNLNSGIGEHNSGYGGYLGQAIEHAVGFTTMHFDEEDELFTYVDETAVEEDKSEIELDEHLNTNTRMEAKSEGGPVSETYEVKAERFWKNLLKLLKWEKSELDKINERSKKNEATFNIFESLSNEKNHKNHSSEPSVACASPTLLSSQNVSRGIFHNLMEVSLIFGDCTRHPKVSNIIVDLLTILNVPSKIESLNPPSLETILHMTTVTVKYFFACCLEEDPFQRAANSNKACLLLSRLSLNVPAARTLALRELLEHALFKPQAVMFGAKFNPVKPFTDDLLLYQNLKQGTSTLLQRDSSIFHAGIIGTGIRKASMKNPIEKHVITNNTTWLIHAIESCCMPEYVTFGENNSLSKQNDFEVSKTQIGDHSAPSMPLEGMEKVALFLVEYISSDVMYNGLPWPEEEHMKVTIERDLHIRRSFNDMPLLWELMFMLTKYPPAVCLCSVLLRALTATLLHQWNSLGNHSDTCINETAKEQAHLDTLTAQTIQLLDLMSVGQLLPKPLSNIRDVIPSLTPNEVVQLIRDSVWSYMRPNEHVPSPLLFKVNAQGQFYRDPETIRPSPLYTDTLRLTLQRNIDKLGEHFWLMFDTTNDDIDHTEIVDNTNKSNEQFVENVELE